MRERKDCPVHEGEELEVEIESIGAKGDGVAKVTGYTIFVPNTAVGNKLMVKVERVLPNYAFAKKM